MAKAKFNAKNSNALINKNIVTIAATGAAFVAIVQETLCAGILHARETGDATPLLRTVQAMPKSARRELAVKFVARYSPVILLPNSNKGEGKCGLLKDGDKGFVAFNYDGAVAGDWTDGAEAADKAALDLLAADKAIYALADRLERGLKTANDNDAKLITSRVVALRGLAKTFKKAA